MKSLSSQLRSRRTAKNEKLLSMAELKTVKLQPKIEAATFFFATRQMDLMWRSTIEYAALLREEKAPGDMLSCITRLCEKLMCRYDKEIHELLLNVDEFHLIDKSLELWKVKEPGSETLDKLINFFHEGKVL